MVVVMIVLVVLMVIMMSDNIVVLAHSDAAAICPRGQYLAVVGTRVCQPCPPGYYGKKKQEEHIVSVKTIVISWVVQERRRG
jgi:RAB protein geranylgeranyltransferase component A